LLPEKKLTLTEKIVKILELMDKICYRLDAVELWQSQHEEHQNRIKKEQIKNTQDFIKDMKVARSGVIKALQGDVTDMNEVVNDQIMFDQRTVDKLTSMVERIQNEVQEKNMKEEEWQCPQCKHIQLLPLPCGKCDYVSGPINPNFELSGNFARTEEKNIKEKKGIEESK
jgi:hypothetical protein